MQEIPRVLEIALFWPITTLREHGDMKTSIIEQLCAEFRYHTEKSILYLHHRWRCNSLQANTRWHIQILNSNWVGGVSNTINRRTRIMHKPIEIRADKTAHLVLSLFFHMLINTYR